MKLIGGPGDGKDVGDPGQPIVQYPRGKEIILYTARKYASPFPIPGWDWLPRTDGYFIGDENTLEVVWYCRNYFTNEQINKIENFILYETTGMNSLMLAYERKDHHEIDKYLPQALKEAHKLAVLTGYDEREEPNDQ